MAYDSGMTKRNINKWGCCRMSNERLRHNKYYDIQSIFDKLYNRSLKKENFKNLIKIISSRENILLAYRSIKRNTGSGTAGVDGLTIKDIEILTSDEVIDNIRTMLTDYFPKAVRRVYISKENGDKRPLGIPVIWERLMQQAILQVLEPICEAKFHKHSYGFRPNRSTHHAIARTNHTINMNKLYFCIDIDIKGFFDNVNHNKLLKQIWTLGIRDKQLLCIIHKMLKAEIDGEGIPTKGTPQGGILSPLLSNIVLNELDWWVSNQWETFNTKKTYHIKVKNGIIDESGRVRAQKSTKLKEVYLIRYADDFKIMCRNYNDAKKMLFAVKDFLKVRLKLEISPTKSKIVNVTKKSSEFLGFKIKAVKKGNKIVAHSCMTDKSKDKAIKNIKSSIKELQQQQKPKNILKLNQTILGIQNYYGIATHITQDLKRINYICMKIFYNRLKTIIKKAQFNEFSDIMQERYKGYNPKLYKIENIVIVPIYAQKYKKLMNFRQKTNSYTSEGRAIIHKKLGIIDNFIIKQVRDSYLATETIEYNDNRISKFISQQGKCNICGENLNIKEWYCHHMIPKDIGGNDRYRNLVILKNEIHIALHTIDTNKIESIMSKYKLNRNQRQRFDKLRLKVNLPVYYGRINK